MMEKEAIIRNGNVSLLSYTRDAEDVVYAAARGCYSTLPSVDILAVGLTDPSTSKTKERVIHDILKSGHHSCLEHASYTFCIAGISRVAQQHLTRHRLASFSVQSLRYTKAEEDQFRIANSIQNNEEADEIMGVHLYNCTKVYKKLINLGIPQEDARDALPLCTTSNITVTMNARELRHFFTVRTCRRAQEEIRDIAVNMMGICNSVHPLLFQDCGPYCATHDGQCKEMHPCGEEPFKGTKEKFACSEKDYAAYVSKYPERAKRVRDE